MSQNVIEQPGSGSVEKRTPPRRSTTRLAGILAVVVGLVGVIGFVAAGGLAKATAGEEMLDGARETATREGSARLRADAELLVDGGFDVLVGELPTIGSALGLGEAELQALIEQRYPAMAAGIAGSSGAAETLEGVVSNLERQADDFERADALPVAAMSLPAAAVATVITAALLVVCGAALLRNDSRVGLIGLVAISSLTLAWLLATQSPQKAAAAERVLDSLNLSGEATGVVAGHFETTSAFLAEYESVFLVDVAGALGVDPDVLRAELSAAHPTAGRLRTSDAAAALQNIGEDVNFRRDNLENFLQVKRQPLGAATWASAALFALVAASSWAALVASRGQ